MILQELVRYYERKSSADEAELAPEGFEYKEIPFVIVLDPDGRFRKIEDTRRPDGKGKRGAKFLVPHRVIRTSTKIAPCLLWDNVEYALGINARGEDVSRKHAAFLARIVEVSSEIPVVSAIAKFLKDDPIEQLRKSQHWDEISDKSNPYVSFRLSTKPELICEQKEAFEAIKRLNRLHDEKAQRIRCLLTGEEDFLEVLHPKIGGVFQFKGGKWARQTSGNIVAFNQRSFESYGKTEKQGENAPVGRSAAFKYTTALKYLLEPDSRLHILVGDTTVVFWADKRCALEDDFYSLLFEPSGDDPDSVRPIESLYKSIEQGSLNIDEGISRFFVLGLVAPNDARISIRFWSTGTVRELSARIKQYFDDISIVPFKERGSKEPLPRHLSLKRLLRSTAQLDKADNIPPNLAGDTLRAILSGLPYPETLLAAALRRIRAEHEVNYPRAALIKACLNRAPRSPGSAVEEDLKVSLDITNTNTGYRLGRLFAALEKIQEDANRGLNATIRDRFYGAASSTPITVFATLMKLSKHHLAKIENRGRAVNLEKLLQEINDGLDGKLGFPAHLSLADQGRFAIGYYHQKQSFYTKKSDTSEGDQ
jgi:CRISPR-associated protein Csd1